MFKSQGLIDPSSEIIDVLIKANDYNMMSRKRAIAYDQISNLSDLSKVHVDTFKTVLPERTGTQDRAGNYKGWNTEKIHSLCHAGRSLLLYGNADITSAQGPEHCHKTLIKKLGNLTNNKDVFLGLMRSHARRSHVYAMIRTAVGSNMALDKDGLLPNFLNNRDGSETREEKEVFPCELGLRYPVLQSIMARKRLHITTKV